MTERNIGESPDVGRGQAPASPRTDRQRKNDRQQSNDRSGWNWLLVPPVIICLAVPLYNRVEPTLFGWPFFYWGQLFAFVALGVITTAVVYAKTKTRRNPDGDAGRSGRSAEQEGR